MKDRISTYPGRITLTPVIGEVNTYDLARADNPIEEGTPLSKANLLSDETGYAIFGADYTNEKTLNNALYEINNVAQNASPKAELLRTIEIPHTKSTNLGVFLATSEIEDGYTYYFSITGSITGGKVNIRNSSNKDIGQIEIATGDVFPLTQVYETGRYRMFSGYDNYGFVADEICKTGYNNTIQGTAFLNFWRTKI